MIKVNEQKKVKLRHHTRRSAQSGSASCLSSAGLQCNELQSNELITNIPGTKEKRLNFKEQGNVMKTGTSYRGKYNLTE